MPRRAASARLALLFGIIVVVTLAAFHWAAHPSVASDGDPLRYALQCSLPGLLPSDVPPFCGPAAAMSAFAHVVCIGPLSSQALASGSHKRAEIKHDPHSKTAAQHMLSCMQGLHVPTAAAGCLFPVCSPY